MLRLASGCVLVLLGLLPDAAGAATIELTNPYFRVYNSIFGHVPGDVYATTLVMESEYSLGSGVTLSHDLGFAAASGSAGTLALEASAWVDFALIGTYLTDRLVADGNATFEADLRVTGGEGTFVLEIEPVLVESSSTTQAGFAIYGENRVNVWDGANVLFGTQAQPTSGVLEYDRLYRIRMFLSAYTFAGPLNRSEYSRSFEVRLSVVPEPGWLLLVAATILALARRAPRPT